VEPVRREVVRERGLIGVLFRNTLNGHGPQVIVVPGSGGGVPEHVAAMLAGEGFTSLALAYFGQPGLPRHLVEVPVEYIATSIDWLRSRPHVTGDKVGIVGGSKGAELALVAASQFPSIGAVVAYAPSSVVWAGVEFFAWASRPLFGVFGTASSRSSWSLNGEGLPFVPHPAGVWPAITRHGISVAPSFDAALDGARAVAAATIPVERINGRVLLVSGGADRMWPSTRMAEMIVERFSLYGSSEKVVDLRYPGAGHRLLPRSAQHGIHRLAGVVDYGGTRDKNNTAARDAWRETVSFLRAELGDHAGSPESGSSQL